MRISVLGSFLLLTAVACNRAPSSTPSGEEARQHVLDAAKAADTVYMSLGEGVRVHPADLILRFDEVLSDSRCRPDVQCVWAGSVRVRLMVAVAAGGGQDVVLETNGPAGAARSTSAGGYSITLLPEVSPPAGQTGRYRIGLELRRL